MTDTDNRDATILALREALKLVLDEPRKSMDGDNDFWLLAGKAVNSTTQAAADAEARIRADEREKCARIAESAPYQRERMICGCSEGLADFTAAAIRASMKGKADE